MKENVTKLSPVYPQGEEPDYIEPIEFTDFRFALGRVGTSPLVVICMNPSAAREESSDRTINRIIGVSKTLGKDGWIVFNLYPERATNATDIDGYNEQWSSKNIETIKNFLVEHNITEVWGAWGDDKGIDALKKGKFALIDVLKEIDVKVFYFGTLTKAGNPRHILQRFEKRNYTQKNYLW